jgi:hypothetical protein
LISIPAGGPPIDFDLPVTVTTEVYTTSAVVDGKLGVTNTATVESDQSDHTPWDSRVSIHTPLKPIPLTAVAISAPSEGSVDEPHTFRAEIQPDNATPPVTYTWQATGQSPVLHTGWRTDEMTFTWSATGLKTVTVFAADSSGTIVSDTHTINVEVPIAGLAASNDGPTELGNLTTLSATVAEGSNVGYAWDFGDGGVGSGWIVSHIYPAPGTYTAVVTASNSVSQMTDTTSVKVTCDPLSGVSIDGPTTGDTSTSYVFTATASPLDATLPITYTWAASHKSTIVHTDGGITDTVQFSWGLTGTQFITVTAVAPCGTAVDDSHSIVISP